jgi:hypothetical protein
VGHINLGEEPIPHPFADPLPGSLRQVKPAPLETTGQLNDPNRIASVTSRSCPPMNRCQVTVGRKTAIDYRLDIPIAQLDDSFSCRRIDNINAVRWLRPGVVDPEPTPVGRECPGVKVRHIVNRHTVPTAALGIEEQPLRRRRIYPR